MRARARGPAALYFPPRLARAASEVAGGGVEGGAVPAARLFPRWQWRMGLGVRRSDPGTLPLMGWEASAPPPPSHSPAVPRLGMMGVRVERCLWRGPMWWKGRDGTAPKLRRAVKHFFLYYFFLGGIFLAWILTKRGLYGGKDYKAHQGRGVGGRTPSPKGRKNG